ncbi:MAG: hypothetical protein JWO67_2998 [Streptosporangiaceae bacterium]|nr:hypothetical protein [Streptosporangiaceae bacterium]
MITDTRPYTIETSEDDNGVQQPTEAIWTPTPENAESNGFLAHRIRRFDSDGHGWAFTEDGQPTPQIFITGVGSEEEPPDQFIALGHGHTQTAIYQAATAYMKRFFAWPDLHSNTEGLASDPARTPLPDSEHAVFLRHPHPDHPCSCEWDGQWRVVYVDPSEPGSVPVTVMRRPGVRR